METPLLIYTRQLMIFLRTLLFMLILAPLTMAAPAGMPVTEQHVLPDVPEPKLLPLLIFFVMYRRILNLLNIKTRNFNNDLAYWKYLINIFNNSEMTVNFAFDRRGKPTFMF